MIYVLILIWWMMGFGLSMSYTEARGGGLSPLMIAMCVTLGGLMGPLMLLPMGVNELINKLWD